MRNHLPSAARDLLFNFCPVALCTIVLVSVSSLAANAQEPVPLARGNTPGEPHHHLKIENEYVRVYYVEVPPHENTQLHQHDHDYIYVSLGPSDVVNAILNKPEIHLQLKDGETHFTRGGFAHVARNLADSPFRNVTIEFLQPQGEAKNLCAPIVSGEGFAVCKHSVLLDFAVETLFETAQIKLDRVSLRPAGKHQESHARQPFLMLGGSQVSISSNDGPARTLAEGEVTWFDVGSKVQFSNQENTNAAFLQITFKYSGAPTNR